MRSPEKASPPRTRFILSFSTLLCIPLLCFRFLSCLLEQPCTPILSPSLMSSETPILVTAGRLVVGRYITQQAAFWAGSDYWMHSPVRTLNKNVVCISTLLDNAGSGGSASGGDSTLSRKPFGRLGLLPGGAPYRETGNANSGTGGQASGGSVVGDGGALISLFSGKYHVLCHFLV